MPNSNSNRSLRAAGIVVAVIIVVVAVVLSLDAWARHQQTTTKASLTNGYATQALGAPFKLSAQQWLPKTTPFATTGQWQYVYTTNLSEPDTVAAAKAQLGRGAYQVDANHPDVIGPTSATLYRDLITEDVALKVTIGPLGGSPGAKATPGEIIPTPVTVILSPLAGE